jgi:hypothetical protein
VEDLVGPVAVVDVPVEDQHALGAVGRRRVARSDRRVAEEAEAHRAVGLGVVARRAQRREAGRGLAGQQRVDEPDAAAGRAQRRRVGRRDGDRVHVDAAAAACAQLLDAADVALGMDREQALARRLRRLRERAAEPALPLHRRLQRDDPRRTLGMAGDIVGERELVAQPDGPGHPGTVRLSWSGPTSSSWAPAPPASTRP